MQKIFFTICFITFMNLSALSGASVTPITATNPIDLANKPITTSSPRDDIVAEDLPDPNNQEEVREFFKKRLENAAVLKTKEPIDISSPSSVSIIHSKEYYEKERESKKTLFQKMYKKAIASLHSDEQKNTDAQNQNGNEEIDEETLQTATRFFRLVQPKIPQEVQIPTVSVPLPSGRRILAPAQEHIPYFLSYIDVQANGFLKVEDTFTIVANGGKFAQGLQRVFPKYAKTSQKIEIILDKVTINNAEVPYIAEEIGSQIIIKPKYKQKIEPGVYTYKFSYMVSNQLLRMKDNNLFLRWNLTGVPLNIFITSANAIVSVPEGHSFTQLQTFIGEDNKLNDRRTNRFRLAGNVMAFSSNTPILNGETMEILGIMDKNIFLKNFDKSFSYFLINWGNILYAFLGFTVILLVLLFSLFTLKKNRNASKFSPSYNGALMRTMLIGKFDRLAFVAYLLDLYRRGIMNISEENNRFFVERNKISKKLPRHEKKFISALFTKKTNQVEVNNLNSSRFARAQKILEKSTDKQVKKYRFIHNIGYLVFSAVILLLTIIFIAMISVNTAQSLIILLSTTVLYAFYIWIIRHKFKHWYITIPMKVLALLSVLLIWIFSSIYIGGITSAIIALTILMIFIFMSLFTEKNNFVNDAKDIVSKYKDYLLNNAESINLSNNFINQQSNIFALDISEYFPKNISNQKYFKLDIAEGLRRTLINIM